MDGSNSERLPLVRRYGEDAAGQAAVAEAAAMLRAGGIVALPTETVYGLAGDSAQVMAVAAIYRAKGRPDFNPLIVHVRNAAQARTLARLDARAELLAARFWPGPLTLVLPLLEGAPLAAAVTAGLPTVALRCPAHPAMQAVLAASGLALAAPSANPSGGISPTSAAHVAAGLGARVPMILDAGPSAAGIESTIVALRDDGWALLRPGPVPAAAIAALLGPPLARPARPGIEAPGQMASHYAPSKPLRLDALEARPGEWLIGFGAVAGDRNLSATGDSAQAAAGLYAALHEADAAPATAIAVAPIPPDGIGAAITDRLRRAAAPR